MLLNHLRTPVWTWDGKAESLCPCCRTLLVAKRPHDKVWHWAHRKYTSQEEGTCLFEESAWALKWRLGYFMFEGWEIEVAKHAGDRVHVIMAMRNPTIEKGKVVRKGQVREFIGKITDKHEARFQFLMGSKSNNVAWMFNGEEWCSARHGVTRDGRGMTDPLKPKAKGLYDRIKAAGQNVMLHYQGKLWREWLKGPERTERTGIWYPLEGEQAMAVLKNYSEVQLPYANTPPPEKHENPLNKLQV